jgi:hypothetical protein
MLKRADEGQGEAEREAKREAKRISLPVPPYETPMMTEGLAMAIQTYTRELIGQRMSKREMMK